MFLRQSQFLSCIFKTEVVTEEANLCWHLIETLVLDVVLKNLELLHHQKCYLK